MADKEDRLGDAASLSSSTSSGSTHGPSHGDVYGHEIEDGVGDLDSFSNSDMVDLVSVVSDPAPVVNSTFE